MAPGMCPDCMGAVSGSRKIFPAGLDTTVALSTAEPQELLELVDSSVVRELGPLGTMAGSQIPSMNPIAGCCSVLSVDPL